eukprot:GHUV01043713.1.p1 GENE.GHUV01043713.1~~GHUV01043713.1.p1  ORF type:complete len:137 (-),score=35.07 GHUV01043713.1:477-887(-)
MNPLAASAAAGVAYHHAGLMQQERTVVEDGYRSGALLVRTIAFREACALSLLAVLHKCTIGPAPVAMGLSESVVPVSYALGTALQVLTATSTLAAGVNLPARRVILRSLWQGVGEVSRAQYLQMVGRAGRAGRATD